MRMARCWAHSRLSLRSTALGLTSAPLPVRHGSHPGLETPLVTNAIALSAATGVSRAESARVGGGGRGRRVAWATRAAGGVGVRAGVGGARARVGVTGGQDGCSLYGNRMGFRGWVRDRLINADAVYGLILYSALVAALSDDDANALDVLVGAVLTLLVFWGAHVFAGSITGHGAERPLGQATKEAIGHSSGMLLASIIPSIPLIFGVFGVISTDEAVGWSLLIAMVILGIIGYRAFAQRGRPIIVRVLGGLGAAMFGFLVILLNILVH